MPYADPLRVGYVVKRYPRFSETFIVNEILAHEAAGMEIEVFSLLPPCDEHFQNGIARVRAPVHYLSAEGLKAVTFWAAIDAGAQMLPDLWSDLKIGRQQDVSLVYQGVCLAREVRQRQITHLHAHFATDAAMVARLAARFARIPYSLTAHAKDIFHEAVEVDDRQQKFEDAEAVITVSDFNCRYLKEVYGPAAAGVRRIYNGLDLGDFPYASPLVRPPEIIAVGRLVEKKGFLDLVEACRVLAARNRQFHCRIVGGGGHEAELRRRIDQLSLEDAVELVGSRPQADVIRLVQRAAVLVAPCVVGGDGDRDGLPTVLLEAMALGTPCVSTGVTGIPEVVRDGQTGLLVPEHDPTALADAIQRLLDDPTLRVSLSTRARAMVEAEFDIHRNTAEMRAIFHAASRRREQLPRRSMQEVG